MAGDEGSRPAARGRIRLLVALLLDGGVADEVTGIRRALTGSEGHLAPHVTLVPPLNVAEPARGEALAVVRAAAARAAPLALVLGPPAFFDRPRAVLYLAVGGDLDGLEALRHEASRPPLDPPKARPARPFVPHVTLARGFRPAEAAARADLLAAYRAPLTCRAVQLLEEEPSPGGPRWRLVASEALGGRTVRGRGGLEVEVQLSEHLDPETAAVLERERAAEHRASGTPGTGERQPFALSARRHGVLLGAVTGAICGRTCELADLFVVAAERGLGVGGRLVEAVIRYAGEAACVRVRLRAPARGAGAAFLEHRGFRELATLSTPEEGPDQVIFERQLP